MGKLIDLEGLNEFKTQMINEIDMPRSLYNLGYFDTAVDNGDGTVTITRQTSYVYLKPDDNWTLGSTYTYVQRFDLSIDCTAADLTEYRGTAIVSKGIPWIHENAFADVNYDSICFNASATKVYVLLDKNIYPDLASFYSWLNDGISIQYKISAPYTEQVIKKQPLNILDQQGSQWARNEYEKSKNVFSGNIEVGTFNPSTGAMTPSSDSTRIRGSELIPLTAGTYTITWSGNVSCMVVYIYDASGNFLSSESWVSWITNTYQFSFTKSFNFMVGFAWRKSDESTVSAADISNVYLGYGGIMHRSDIEPMLLWQNSSPTSAFSSQTIHLSQSMYNFRYIVIETNDTTNSDCSKVTKVKTNGNNEQALVRLIYGYSNATKVCTRNLIKKSGLDIYVESCFANGSTSNSDLIPIAIYGTNVL